ncbi:MAG TPA: malectin domain-containing carbohydrate-binding protein [Ktedonosporobacter sp.]|nr:malectin domain-containing carbohydrate-binding protein [Ktedonosporobacter sp.]
MKNRFYRPIIMISVCLLVLLSTLVAVSPIPTHAATSGGIAISAGGSGSGSFVADTDFSGGSTVTHNHTVDLSGVSNPAPEAVYQSERYGNFSYAIPKLTAGGSYLVRLHEAETFFSSTGRRAFNVSINGTQVLSNFDIVAAAGAANKAVIEQFTVPADTSGTITIQFATVTNHAKVDGIEIIPNSSGTPTPTPTPTATVGPTPTPTATVGPTPTSTPVITPTPITGTPVTIMVNTASNGNAGTDFAGFSYEKDRVGAGMFDVNNTNLVNLFRRLGPSSLRLGGNLVDIVNWNANGAGGSASEIAPADVTKLAGFLQATGWKALYGINLKTNNPANAASEAKFVSQALGSSLQAFEIGNEPDFYTSESGYESSFNSYVSAIKAVVPNAAFDGPGGSDHHPDWATIFGPHEKNNSLVMLATHMYIGDKTTATISGMLASNASGKLPNGESTLGSAKSASGVPLWRMTEANSYFHGGAAGVSNVQAAGLWSLDFMYGVASNNGDGVNFHGGTSTQFTLNYSPITFNGLTPTGVQGVYYGELLWELAGTGSLHAASVSGGSSVSAWGIGNNAIVNNKGTTTIKATITLPASATSATVYIMTAPSLSSTAITINGSSVSANGAFTPSTMSASVSGNQVVIGVPAGSAALVVTQ